MTGGDPDAFTTTTFMKKYGIKTLSGWHELFILETHIELPFPRLIVGKSNMAFVSFI